MNDSVLLRGRPRGAGRPGGWTGPASVVVGGRRMRGGCRCRLQEIVGAACLSLEDGPGTSKACVVTLRPGHWPPGHARSVLIFSRFGLRARRLPRFMMKELLLLLLLLEATGDLRDQAFFDGFASQ